MIVEYLDKNGRKIEEGMTLIHEDGSLERVYCCGDDSEGNVDLGFNASNEDFLERWGTNREYYPLYQFNLSEWKIWSNENEQ